MERFLKTLLTLVAVSLHTFGPSRAISQTFKTLHSFQGSDGATPVAGLVLSGKRLYGTTRNGGAASNGTVFALNTDGTGFTNLHHFTGGSDGAAPAANLILSSSKLYGTTSGGGSSSNGTVFAVNTDGTGFKNLHSLNGSEGASPLAGLRLSGDALYGTANSGGVFGFGTVFRLNTDGSGFTNLASFQTPFEGFPAAGLVLSSNTLYGTIAGVGGPVPAPAYGGVFAVNTDGTGFAILHTFSYGGDGGIPLAALVIASNTLCGTTSQNSFNGLPPVGTVFKLNSDGTSFVTLHGFGDGCCDGGPQAGLVLAGSTLYGTTLGTIFSVNTDGTGFRTLYTLPPERSEGGRILGNLVLSCNALFGTTSICGNSTNGTVYRVSLPPPKLTIVRSGNNLILAWTADACGFELQSVPSLTSPTSWIPVSPAPVALGGQSVVVSPISGTQQFFRLRQCP